MISAWNRGAQGRHEEWRLRSRLLAWRCSADVTRLGWLSVTLLVVAVMAGVVAPTAALEPMPREFRTVVSAGQPEWTVQWQARITEPGGQFRLYSGSDPATLRLIHIQQAVNGFGGYRYRHAPNGIAWNFYQLRYLTSTGREVILANLRVLRVGVHQAPGSMVELPTSGVKALSEMESPLLLTSHPRALPRDVELAEAPRPEPEVPPPRAAA